MWISNIELDGFRNYKELFLELPQGLVFIHGDNGQGKSNLLEAIHLVSIFRSFRASRESELINWNVSRTNSSKYALITAKANSERTPLTIKLMIENQSSERFSKSGNQVVEKRVRLNGSPKKISELVGLIPSILFSPDDIQLIAGPPSIRRRFLDLMISQVNPLYLDDLRRYLKILGHRNKLLRTERGSKSLHEQLSHWDIQLAKSGSNILIRRYDAIKSLQTNIQPIFNSLTSGADEFSLTYTPTVPINTDKSSLETSFLDKLTINQSRDMSLGSTTIGPHRDDISLCQNGRYIATYASRGQARIIALILKLGQAKYTEQFRREQPILLLDDVLAELDEHYRDRLIQHTVQYQQSILTSTNPTISKPTHQTTCLSLKNGIFSRHAKCLVEED